MKGKDRRETASEPSMIKDGRYGREKISERKHTGKEILRKKEGKCAEAVLVW
jgi:hypothetical protein